MLLVRRCRGPGLDCGCTHFSPARYSDVCRTRFIAADARPISQHMGNMGLG
ncbi:hypothetical protein DVS28_a1166 [Euzebya pacifica]|uniref:Uncharacterized protein n=1 Tax=Euzebya pacifica TaxID=1608957 RepID=A0A346XUG9_9ACTN|nr:hypothetical protein DVS28_a1166 [Euzebya pacifica]